MAYIAIIPDSSVTKDQLEKISQEVFDKAKKENPKATNLFVSFTDTDIDGVPYTYGQIQSINEIDGGITKCFIEHMPKYHSIYSNFRIHPTSKQLVHPNIELFITLTSS